jgi:tryptophan synthase alpha chain
VSRLEERLQTLKSSGKKALVAYLCVGDPDLETSIAVAKAAVDAGADVLELGVPFSDPISDGPVIARAGARAIKAGGSLRKTLEAARAIRAASDVPLVLFTYYNPVFVRGAEVVVKEAVSSGIDGLLIVDLPPEEGTDLRDAAERAGLPVIPLLTPTSDDARIASALRRAGGFVYYVSVTGVTGSAAVPVQEAAAAATRLRKRSELPVVVGFGIDSREKARAIAAGADGVVVGTALVRAVESSRDRESAVAAVTALIRELRSGLDERSS